MLFSLSLPNGTHLSVIDEIGTKYEQLGIKLLKDDDGNTVDIIKHDERTVSAIITRILREWLAGRGLQQTWGTLLKVLNEMKLNELANNIACSLNHHLLKHDHDEH